MSELISKQCDHGLCEVILSNGVKCFIVQVAFEYIQELETKLQSQAKQIKEMREILKFTLNNGVYPLVKYKCEKWLSNNPEEGV